MKKKEYSYAIGVMSGTSLDGVDLCYIKFYQDEAQDWQYQILATACYDYSDDWIKRLSNAHLMKNQQVRELDTAYTNLLADSYVKRFIDEFDLEEIDFVASHGHTVFHQPEKNYTLQIGNLPFLADRVGYPVICDFRMQDVKKGGQGAPLVPIGDKLLFAEYEACVNMGGFVNVSIKNKDEFLAYDICPANKVLNYLSKQLGYPFDRKGQLAASGKVDEQCLAQLDQLDFYRQKPPKSLGIEWVEKEIFPILEKSQLLTIDQLATFTQHIAHQLAKHLKGLDQFLMTGGGTYNQHLINLVEKQIGQKITIPDDQLINYKEALVFAFLGLLRFQDKNNILASVTGAPADHCGGFIYQPQKS